MASTSGRGAVRDLVEIGMGRTARQAFELDDIEIVPSRRTRSSGMVSTAWQIDAYRFDIPLITHPSDAIVSPDSAVAVGQLGGLGVLNAEGLWSRHSDAEKVIDRLAAAAEDGDPRAAVRMLRELHAAPIQPDLLAESVKRIRESGVTVAVRVQSAPGRRADARPARGGRGDPRRAGHDRVRRARGRGRGTVEPQAVHLRTGRAGDRGRCGRLPHRDAPDAHRCRWRDRRPRAQRGHHSPRISCWASACRWRPRSWTPPPRAGTTWTRPVAGTCT